MIKTYSPRQRKEAVDSLFADLENGLRETLTSEKFKEYLRFNARFHHYSWSNCLLIFTQKPDATRVAGFSTWKSLGRSVKKGEKGIKIFAPLVKKYAVEEKPQNGVDEDDKEKDKEGKKYIVGYKVVYVFDYSQTEGKSAPVLERGGPETGYLGYSPTELIKAAVKASRVPVSFEEIKRSGVLGYYSLKEEKIVIKNGLSPEKTLSVLFHEMGHSVMHCKETDFDTPEEEMQAESVAYIVSSYFGAKAHQDNFNYIAVYSKTKKAEEIKKFLDLINKTADGIIEKIESELKASSEKAA